MLRRPIALRPTGLALLCALLFALGAAGCGGGDLLVTKRRLFITRAAYTGNLGGLLGGDNICSNAAAGAGMAGKFFAWLSDGQGNALERATDGAPWYAVASESAPLFHARGGLASQPEFPIHTDEYGVSLTGARYWTGAHTGGFPADACDGWTNDTDAKTGLVGDGGAGYTWTEVADDPCASRRSVLCFQQ